MHHHLCVVDAKTFEESSTPARKGPRLDRTGRCGEHREMIRECVHHSHRTGILNVPCYQYDDLTASRPEVLSHDATRVNDAPPRGARERRRSTRSGHRMIHAGLTPPPHAGFSVRNFNPVPSGLTV